MSGTGRGCEENHRADVCAPGAILVCVARWALGCGAARLVRRRPGTHTGSMRRQPTDPVFAAEPLPPERLCDHPGCECGGDFRAPPPRVAPDRLPLFRPQTCAAD